MVIKLPVDQGENTTKTIFKVSNVDKNDEDVDEEEEVYDDKEDEEKEDNNDEKEDG